MKKNTTESAYADKHATVKQLLGSFGTVRSFNLTYQLLTEKETAVLLGVSISKLQQDRIKGAGIRYVKLGKAVRYRLDDIAAFIETNTFQSTAAVEENRRDT